MGKRIRRRWDLDRAELLGQPELSVERGKGGPDYFYGWNLDPDVDACPLCGGKVIKMQDLFSKTYKDIINDNGKKRVVSLEYGFHKWRCLNDQCRHIFAKEIEFASKYDNVTYRLEEEIASKVMQGHTYGEIYNQLQGSISRQTVGQIFNRWVRKKEELRKLQSPPSIGYCFYNTGIPTYVWIINKDKPESRKGKVQLIDASKCFLAWRKPIGNKRHDIAEASRKLIVQAYGEFQTRVYEGIEADGKPIVCRSQVVEGISLPADEAGAVG